MWKSLTTLTLAAAAIFTGVGPASAANQYIVDKGTVGVFKPAEAGVTGTFEEYVDHGTRVALDLTVERGYTGPACVFARVVFSTGDGPTTVDSGVVCWNDAVQSRGMTATSPADVASYAVKIVGLTSRTAPTGTLLVQRTYLMGPDTESTGDSWGRLDRDLLTASNSGARAFTGWTDYAIDPYFLEYSTGNAYAPTLYVPAGDFLRSRVQGDLTWASTMSGTSAYAVITWTYTDGSTSTFVSGSISPGLTRHIDASSIETKDVWSVKVDVLSTLRLSTLGVQASTGTVKFGDYLTP
jgi:hypothetical protein